MSNINDFVIENGVLKKYIGSDSRIVIPKEVSCIDKGAFIDCDCIEKIEIGANVTRVCEGALEGCKNLKYVYVLNAGIHEYHICGLDYHVYDGHVGTVKTFLWYIRKGNNKVYSSSCRYFPVLDEELTTLDLLSFSKYEGCTYLGTVEDPYLIFVNAEEKDTDDIFIHSTTKYIDKSDSTSKMDMCALREYSNLRKITWLSSEFSKLDPELKLLCALGFVESDYNGEEIDNDVRTAYLKYIKSQRKKLYSLMSQNTALFYYMIKNKVVAKEYLNDIFAEVQANGDTEKMAAILPLISGEKKQSDDFEFGGVSLDLSVAEAKKNWAFENIESVIKITAYKGKETIVTVPDSIGGKPVVTIGEHAFSPEKPRILSALKPYLKSIVEVILPLSVTKIENSAFEECVSLEKITVSPELAFVGELAFKNCRALSSFEMPKKEIHLRNAFLGCSRLSNKEGLVIINGTVITLTAKKKKTIMIDETVKKVNLAAFSSQFDFWKGAETRVQISNPDTEVYHSRETSIFEIVKCNNRIILIAPQGSLAQLYVENLPLEAQKYIKFEKL